ncbi:putative thiopurine S-methyltransferase isoform X1 [Crassostrea virginica]
MHHVPKVKGKSHSNNTIAMTEDKQSQFTVVSPEYWQKRWEERKIGWHKTNVDSLLEKHVDKLINDRNNIRIFFPFCGKALDMKYLWEMGHVIVGVEVARAALEEFFEENSIKYTVSDLPDGAGSLFTSEDNRIHLYCCDLFSFKSDFGGPMNGVWDRGALVAINKEDIPRYVEILSSLLAPDFCYLVETFEFDETKHSGPPFFVSDKDLNDLYGGKFTLTKLDRQDAFEEQHKAWGIDSFFEKLHLITPKK